MKIYICDTPAQAQILISQWGSDKLIDVNVKNPVTDVVVYDQANGTAEPKVIGKYIGLSTYVLVFRD